MLISPSGTLNVISLEEVSICYKIQEEASGGLKEFIIRFLQRQMLFREFWALTKVTLEISQGECFGIIGPNGAGKSTLLKVISRVISPTLGRVKIIGDVSPLLELGAGFHPELTGRENIYLNGTLLGHTRKEIKSKLDEILSFSDIDGFVDAPLRTFSSGMVARLGFSIATTWQPEILLLDETLSVGDQEFRKKCSQRMQEFCKHGSTILIATHDLGVLQSLCKNAIWLEGGRSKMLGPVKSVIEEYAKVG